MNTYDSSFINIAKNSNVEQKIMTKDQKKLKEVSQEFEALFVKMMIDGMEKTVDKKNSMFHGGQAEEMFQGMLNEQRAKDMSKSGGMGIAEQLYRQLSKNISSEDAKEKSEK